MLWNCGACNSVSQVAVKNLDLPAQGLQQGFLAGACLQSTTFVGTLYGEKSQSLQLSRSHLDCGFKLLLHNVLRPDPYGRQRPGVVSERSYYEKRT